MAGLSAFSSKLKYLSSVTVDKVRGKQVSVVTYTDPDNITFPANCNESGILLVPQPFECSPEGSTQWLAMVEQHQRKQRKQP